MKGTGQDATSMFDEIHAWVNFEQLLAKCYIGPLQDEPQPLEEIEEIVISPIEKETITPVPTPTSTNLTPTHFEQPKPVSPSITSIISSSDDEDNQGTPNYFVPRFDWVQKTSEIVLMFSTKAFCNPGLIVEFINNLELTVRIIINNHNIFFYRFQVANNVQWPCRAKIYQESGKIEVIFHKLLPGLWTDFGQMETDKMMPYDFSPMEYDIDKQINITHNSYALILRPKNNSLLHVTPLGHHIAIKAQVNGETVTRSYTPVPNSYMPLECPTTCIPLLVKAYPNGALSTHITRPCPHATSLQVLPPTGNFMLQKIKHHNRVALLAAGSGITPILGVLDYLIERSTNKL